MQLKKNICGCGENDENVTITNKNHSSLVLRDELVIFWRSKVMDPRHVFGHNLKNTGVEIIITKMMDKRVAPEVGKSQRTPVSKHPTVQQKVNIAVQQKMAVKLCGLWWSQ